MPKEKDMGPCMCGDIMCPSCGPAQGYNPDFEIVCAWLDHVLDDLPSFDVYDVETDLDDVDSQIVFYSGKVDKEALAEELANRLSRQPQELADVIVKVARQWEREQS